MPSQMDSIDSHPLMFLMGPMLAQAQVHGLLGSTSHFQPILAQLLLHVKGLQLDE
jgi:hypothetical protein